MVWVASNCEHATVRVDGEGSPVRLEHNDPAITAQHSRPLRQHRERIADVLENPIDTTRIKTPRARGRLCEHRDVLESRQVCQRVLHRTRSVASRGLWLEGDDG